MKFDSIKVGDKVVMCGRGHTEDVIKYVGTVTAVTPKTFTVQWRNSFEPIKHKKETGYAIGYTWRYVDRIATAEDLAQFESQQAAKKAKAEEQQQAHADMEVIRLRYRELFSFLPQCRVSFDTVNPITLNFEFGPLTEAEALALAESLRAVTAK